MNAVNLTTENVNFDIFFKSTSKTIVLTTASGEICSINPSAQKLFGYHEPELLHQDIKLLIPGLSDSKQLDIAIQNCLTVGTNNNSYVEMIAQKKDGEDFVANVNICPYELGQTKLLLFFICDITIKVSEQINIQKKYSALEIDNDKKNKELIKANNTLEILNEKLELSLAYQKAILDNAGVMLMVIDKVGFVKFFNPEATHITGYTKEEIIDKASPVIFIDQTDIHNYRKQFFDEFGLNIEDDFELIRLKAERNLFHEVECNIIKKDGTHVFASMTITPILDKNNETTSYLAFAVDISDRKHIEENLKQSLKREKELGELKTRFVSIASHEFRTPLSTILSSAFLTGKYTATEDQHKRDKHLDRIVSSVNLLTDILNDFLNVGKIEEGKINVHQTEFDLAHLLKSIIKDLNANLKNGQKFRYAHEGITIIQSDSSLIRNILNNLISNAIKFSLENAVIDIKSQNDGEHFNITVKDQGIGISEEDRVHLMERFFRGSNALNIQGTGLGLHIVSKYVECLRGSITCESKLNEGTIFQITLPDGNHLQHTFNP